jgi:arylsulfatase A-like enzyme
MVTQRRRARGFLCAATILLLNLLRPALPEKPNIVILFGDNLAYNDVSIFGAATSKTPNIDRIGMEGLKLNNWNSAAHLCSASRAALLTGKYPVRMGVYPRVFRPDAVYGMMPSETTIAEYLKRVGYATSCVGKWHLGHRDEFLPINQGFDEWVGIPYHMSGGSIDNHTCNSDVNESMWLPLYEGNAIIEQPVRVQDLAARYATAASNFILRKKDAPFFLYMAFSHVHQLCAPRDFPEQSRCQWASVPKQATFVDAVEEMDWIVGKILQTLDGAGVTNNTLVIFTSDNGPWVAEQSCSGSKGPFEGRWLQQNVDQSCTACPHDYVPEPTPEQPRRCVLPGTHLTLDGVHCGADTGLGSTWEANLRMPALVRWPGHVAASTETMQMVSTLDVLPTVLSIVGSKIPDEVDGKDITHVLTGKYGTVDEEQRVLFFWRDGFRDGALPPPYGRMDVAAAKLGRFKAWFWTKSAHYNMDEEVHHDPPLLFDVLADPAEAFQLNTEDHQDIIDQIVMLVAQHKKSIDWTYPWALPTDSKYIPCYDPSTGCRTTPEVYQDTEISRNR